MIIKLESSLAKKLRRKDWHKWFAWRPIRIDENTVVWLQYIERRILCNVPYYRLTEEK